MESTDNCINPLNAEFEKTKYILQMLYRKVAMF